MASDHKYWKEAVAEFQESDFWRASWQLLNSVGSYIAVWIAMYFVAPISWWLVLPLALLASALFIRVFIIFHDCGHGSFFKSKRANTFWGCVTGLLTFTPYHHWRWEHSVHHSSNGHLERRGVGDIWTMTVDEYLAAGKWKRFTYRVARNPLVLFLIAPVLLFVVQHRFPLRKAKLDVKISVWITNLVLAAFSWGLISMFGFSTWLIIQLGVLAVAGSIGVWLFYVQHQFEDTYWESGGEWDYVEAALRGSSYYKLPRILQWFSGNIGFHHIHHLSSKIPNYNLEDCHSSHELFRDVKPLTVRSSLKTIRYRLWDQASSKLISFSDLRKLAKTRVARSC